MTEISEGEIVEAHHQALSFHLMRSTVMILADLTLEILIDVFFPRRGLNYALDDNMHHSKLKDWGQRMSQAKH